MATSDAVTVDFATLQAIRDLLIVARTAKSETIKHVAAGAPIGISWHALETLVLHRACRMSNAEERALEKCLILAATLPDEHPDAFVFATTVLIADRLQHGGVEDDLFWHWDAFRATYLTLSPHIRAAVIQGFYRMHVNGRVALIDPPTPDERATVQYDDVEASLRDALPEDVHISAQISRAVAEPEEAGTLAERWERDGPRILELAPHRQRPLIAGFRYLYETTDGFRPFDETRFRFDDKPALLPPQLS